MQGESAPCQCSASSLCASLPACSFTFHAPWPRDAFREDRTACASHRTEEAALLYGNLYFQQVFLRMDPSLRTGMQHPLRLSHLLDLWSVCSPHHTQTCNGDSALQCSLRYVRGWFQTPCAAQLSYPSGTKRNRATDGLGLALEGS